jgi:hypothetical protein
MPKNVCIYYACACVYVCACGCRSIRTRTVHVRTHTYIVDVYLELAEHVLSGLVEHFVTEHAQKYPPHFFRVGANPAGPGPSMSVPIHILGVYLECAEHVVTELAEHVVTEHAQKHAPHFFVWEPIQPDTARSVSRACP